MSNNRVTIVDSGAHFLESADYNPEDYNKGEGGDTGISANRLRSCSHFGSSITIEGGVYLESDRRIKHDIQQIDLGSCLNVINKIPLYKYKYNNFVTRDKKNSYGFMAQDVEKVLPAVVSRKEDYLPCVMEYANDISWKQQGNKWLLHIPVLMYDASNNPIDFKIGTEFKFYLTDDYKKIDGSKPTISTLRDGNNFLVKHKKEFCLVVGYKTTDFLTLEKERLFTIYHGAIQELDRKHKREIAEKNNEITELKSQLASLTSRMESLEASVLALQNN